MPLFFMSDNIFFDKALEREREKEFTAVGFKNQRRNLKYKEHPIGKSNKSIDAKRDALLMGKRLSKNGNIYYEYRKNRGDLKDSNI
jgi:hypothetical protein